MIKYKFKSYTVWRHMLQRCRDKNAKDYRYYGGRGIVVCERWKRFENFLADMGERPSGMSIERKNNDGNYEPGNCIWATIKQQNLNKRWNVRITLNGETMTVIQWSERLGLPPKRIYQRLARGWSPEAALRMRPLINHSRRNGAAWKQERI